VSDVAGGTALWAYSVSRGYNQPYRYGVVQR